MALEDQYLNLSRRYTTVFDSAKRYLIEYMISLMHRSRGPMFRQCMFTAVVPSVAVGRLSADFLAM